MTNKRVREGLKSPGQALVKANVHGHDPALAAPVDARRFGTVHAGGLEHLHGHPAARGGAPPPVDRAWQPSSP